jgi:hypothetical protein
MPDIVLHGAAGSPFVRKVGIVLAEKGLAYEHVQTIPVSNPPPGLPFPSGGVMEWLGRWKEGTMSLSTKRITPCLWFDTQAEEAANAYVSIFENSRTLSISRYGKEGYEIHGKEAGSVMTVEFELEGQRFVASTVALFKFNEAVSFQIHCEHKKKSTTFGTHWPRRAKRVTVAG